MDNLSVACQNYGDVLTLRVPDPKEDPIQGARDQIQLSEPATWAPLYFRLFA